MGLNQVEINKHLKNWNRLNHNQMDLYYIANSSNLTEQEKEFYMQSYDIAQKDRSIPYMDRLLPPGENIKNQTRLLGSNYKNYKYFVYRFLNADGNVLYVGKSTNLYNRMFGHFRTGHLHPDVYESVERIEYIVLNSQREMNSKEMYYIQEFNPTHNTVKNNHVAQVDELDEWINYDFVDELKAYIPFLKDLKEKQIAYRQLLLDLLEHRENEFMLKAEIDEQLNQKESLLFF